MKKINILETTLRDGSYAINFSFSTKQTELIGKELERCGFKYIEIGHGIGLGASEKNLGKASHTDEEYLITASESFTQSKFGMFCIPGIATLDQLHMAIDYNMGFVRVGTEVTKVHESKPFIEKAKKANLFVGANYMKSYSSTPKDFAEKVKMSESFGADLVYIVDSAGGMFIEDIKKYFEAVRMVSDIPIGFHGHNNLGLAVSNSLQAAEMGIDFIDSSLQGMGRSSGNAPTENLVAALIKKGFSCDINLLEMLELGPKYIVPLFHDRSIMPLDVISGYAEFHSSYMPHIQKAASQFSVNPALLIMAMTKIDKVDLDLKKLNFVAEELALNNRPPTSVPIDKPLNITCY